MNNGLFIALFFAFFEVDYLSVALYISIRDQSVLVNWIVPDSDPSYDFRSGKPLPFKHRTGTDHSFPFEKRR
ncbi:MAG: hypothetical protein DWH73_03880 [Planctomycetota bacterium]|nr:MAG: hypothetical protein DWH73_03880 [Planctomycetota bacterium]